MSFQWFVASKLAKAVGAEPSGPMRNEKLHAIVARSTFGSENIKNTSRPEHFCQLTCRKSERRCGAKHIWKSKCAKHSSVGPLLEVEIFWKSEGIVAQSTLGSKHVKDTPFSRQFLKFEMLKKRTPFWREARFDASMPKCKKTPFSNHCNHSKKHNDHHRSVHQWVRSVTHASQQLTSLIVSYLWNLPPPPCTVLVVRLLKVFKPVSRPFRPLVWPC